MKILLMADSHREKEVVSKIVTENIDNVDMVIHLGDGIAEFIEVIGNYSDTPYYYVVGNHEGNNYRWNHYDQAVIIVEGHRILLIHGDKHNVKLDLIQLKYAAKQEKCDVVFFAHTHKKHDETQDGIRMINPGAVMFERDVSKSYAIIDISNDDITVDFRTIEAGRKNMLRQGVTTAVGGNSGKFLDFNEYFLHFA